MESAIRYFDMENVREMSVYEIFQAFRKNLLLIVIFTLSGAVTGLVVSSLLPAQYAYVGFMKMGQYGEIRGGTATYEKPLADSNEVKAYLTYSSNERSGDRSAFLKSVEPIRAADSEAAKAFILTVYGPSLKEAQLEIERLQTELYKKYQPRLDKIAEEFKAHLSTISEYEGRLKNSSDLILAGLNTRSVDSHSITLQLLRNSLLNELAQVRLEKNAVVTTMSAERNFNFHYFDTRPLSNSPIAPKTKKIIFLSTLFAFALGCISALIYEYGSLFRLSSGKSEERVAYQGN